MSAPTGANERTLATLRHLGRATSSTLAAQLGVGAEVVLTRLRKLEHDGKVKRVGVVANHRSRPAILWAIRVANLEGATAIPAANSDEFIARGGQLEVLPGLNWSKPDRYPQFKGMF